MCRESLIDFSRYEIHKDGSIWSKHWNREVKGTKTPDGYLRVNLVRFDGKKDTYMLNRVIYYFFNGDIPQEMNVNHIDEQKLNNSINNLNLLTHRDNCNWGTRNERISKSHKGRKRDSPSEETKRRISEVQTKRLSIENTRALMYKQIWQYKNDNLVAVFKSIKEASEKTGFSKSCISQASRGVLNRAGNHKLGEFMFYNDRQL